jgi:hypothetical protein
MDMSLIELEYLEEIFTNIQIYMYSNKIIFFWNENGKWGETRFELHHTKERWWSHNCLAKRKDYSVNGYNDMI